MVDGNGSMLAADNWCVKVNDKVYGPYTSQQLRKFAHEGRLAAWSLIAPAGSRSWRRAQEESTFSSFFGAGSKQSASHASRSFGKRDIVDIEPKNAAQAGNVSKDTSNKPKPRTAKPTSQSELANFVIVFDVVSAAASRAEAAVLSLGPGFRIADNVWTISCNLTATGVRNAIAPYLLPHESIFVVDTTNGKTVWQNYAPELHAKLTAAWITPKRTIQ